MVEEASRRKFSISEITNKLAGEMHPTEPERDSAYLLHRLANLTMTPKIVLINTYREILPPGKTNSGSAGEGLIEMIATLQNPEAIHQPEAEQKYDALNRFVSEVIEEDNIKLEVPASKSTINIRMRNNVVLPLHHHGSGIHQVIVMAARATEHSDTVICIEEPEINLHPVLQRRLLHYLTHHTTNQYIIATHSAQMLDYEDAKIFHLELGDSGTNITPATTTTQVAKICADLGYRPSDLLQANAVIWVEGPSDRVYVNHWLNHANPALREGIHYSVMFYGGSLLRELTAEDPAVTEFIRLPRLNRNFAIIMDSDKTGPRKSINATKRRIIEELEASSEHGTAWVTDGYTIENYIPVELLKSAVKHVHPRTAKKFSEPGNKWENPLGCLSSPDKVKIARRVVETWRNPLDSNPELKKRVGKLIDLVRQANSGLYRGHDMWNQ